MNNRQTECIQLVLEEQVCLAQQSIQIIILVA